MILHALSSALFGFLLAENEMTGGVYNFLIMLGFLVASKNAYISIILSYILLSSNDIKNAFLSGISAFSGFSFTTFTPEILFLHLLLASYFINKNISTKMLLLHIIILILLLLLTPFTPLLYDILLILLFYKFSYLKSTLFDFFENAKETIHNAEKNELPIINNFMKQTYADNVNKIKLFVQEIGTKYLLTSTNFIKTLCEETEKKIDSYNNLEDIIDNNITQIELSEDAPPAATTDTPLHTL